MNRDTEELMRQLETATSRELIDNSTLDDETALLREGWLSLGQLLAGQDDPQPVVTLAPAKSGSQSGRAWMLACAATAIVTLVTGWYIFSLSPKQGDIDAAQVEGRSWFDNTPDELAWDDSLDHDLAQVRLAIWHVGGSRERRDLNWQYVRGELQQMSEDLENGSL